MFELQPDDISLVSRGQLLAVIQAQAEILIKGLNEQQVMEKMALLAEDLTHAAGAVVELIDGEDMVYQAATGVARQQLGMHIRAIDSLSGLCVRENKVLNCEDVSQDPRVNKEACDKIGIQSMLVCPLRFDGELLGVLKVLSPHKYSFDDIDEQILDLAARLIAVSMHAAHAGQN